MVKWLRKHCFKDKEKWFGKRYISIEYDLFDVVFGFVSAFIYFIGSFIYLYLGGNSILLSLLLSFGCLVVCFGYAYLGILYKHFIWVKRKKD